MPRKLGSFIQGFMEYTATKGSVPIFCLWAAIGTVAAALERKVWTTNNKGPLHPNLYTLLIGPPGGGKSQALTEAYDLFSTLEAHHLASSNVSRASLVDNLREAERVIVMPGHNPPNMSFNSLFILADELAVLMPAYDHEFLGVLNQLYIGGAYSERKRTRDLKFTIPNPQFNILAGTQPGFLSDFLPEAAWNQGFLSRTILIYNGMQVLTPLWGGPEVPIELWDKLVHDLHIIGELYGEFNFTQEAAELISKWHMDKGPPTPAHPKLIYYTQRRTAHLIKLCMIASAAVSDDLLITVEHFREALGWLLEAEHFMPDIFKAMKTGGDARAMEECWYFASEMAVKEKRPIAEGRLIAFLAERVPAHSVQRILDVMEKAKMFKRQHDPSLGWLYTPRKNDVL